MNSDFRRCAAFLLGMVSSAFAAEITLQDDGKLTGEVASMDAEGNVELLSPISEKPLRIRGDKALRIDFGSAGKAFEPATERVELSNGDILAARVNSLADGLLNVESADLGEISIPRAMVSSIQLGISTKKVIYSGPKDFEGWTRDEGGAQSWKMEGGEFVAEEQGIISMDAGLPEKFIIRFSMKWSNYPNFQFRFAEPPGGNSGRVDRYLLQFVGSGLGVFRESGSKSGNIPIAVANRSSGRDANNSMQVEIRVDRSRSHLQLFIDGQLQGRYTDPVPGIPSGTGISLVNRAPRQSDQRIGQIEVLEWDDSADRHRSEERGEGGEDSLIGRNGERLGGKLTSIRRDGGKAVYMFKSDFQKDLLAVPEQEVSTVFVGDGAKPAKKSKSGGMTLSLRGGGQMEVSSCVFRSGKVTAEHPLLGSLDIDRDAILSLQRRAAPKANPLPSR
ncbi:hypothetical protein HZ994_17330 [Akkermansiaceae bacterium]|nr:hypothetical protein HZ994_17330 [Akkermansiaceae bacterium]